MSSKEDNIAQIKNSLHSLQWYSRRIKEQIHALDADNLEQCHEYLGNISRIVFNLNRRLSELRIQSATN